MLQCLYLFADRYHDQSGNTVRADSPEHFLTDLLALGYVNVKKQFDNKNIIILFCG